MGFAYVPVAGSKATIIHDEIVSKVLNSLHFHDVRLQYFSEANEFISWFMTNIIRLFFLLLWLYAGSVPLICVFGPMCPSEAVPIIIIIEIVHEVQADKQS